MRARKKEGHALAETADMKAWKKEFEKLTLDDHVKKLQSLGLDEEEIKEFKEDFDLQKKKKAE